MKQLNLNELNILVSVAECQSFSTAAKQLGMQKSKISRAISSLEETVGGPLFYRTTREVTLTTLGRRLYAHALPGIESLRSGIISALQDTSPMSGTIRITAVEDIGAKILTPLIAKFAMRHPQLRFDMIYSLEVLDLVKHSVDLAIRVAPTKQQSYRIQKVGEIQFILVASPRLIEFTTPNTTPSDLRAADMILWNADNPSMRNLQFSRGKDTVAFEFQPRFRATSSEAMLAMAKLGCGIAHLPRFYCDDAIREGSLVEVCRGWHLPARPISIVTPARRNPSPSVTNFTRYLAQELAQSFPKP